MIHRTRSTVKLISRRKRHILIECYACYHDAHFTVHQNNFSKALQNGHRGGVEEGIDSGLDTEVV